MWKWGISNANLHLIEDVGGQKYDGYLNTVFFPTLNSTRYDSIYLQQSYLLKSIQDIML